MKFKVSLRGETYIVLPDDASDHEFAEAVELAIEKCMTDAETDVVELAESTNPFDIN